MKRIIDGKTYNTETATKVAVSLVDFFAKGAGYKVSTLYVTRGGAFFADGYDPEMEEFTLDPLTRDKAQQWILDGEVELFNNVFEDPPEASEDQSTEPEARIYLRVPEPLKRQIDKVAKDEGQSVNAWVMRCVEKCLSSRTPVGTDMAPPSGG